MRPWEVLIEMIGRADSVVALTVAEDVAVLAEGDLHSEAVGVLTAAGTGEIGRCLKPHVVTAGKNVKCLLDLQTVNRFIVVIVLRKWEMAEEMTLQEMILDLKPRFQLQVIPNWRL
jgi:hypothetical protein